MASQASEHLRVKNAFVLRHDSFRMFVVMSQSHMIRDEILMCDGARMLRAAPYVGIERSMKRYDRNIDRVWHWQ